MKAKKIIVITTFISILFCTLQSKDYKKTSIFVEFGGSGIVSSLNFDYRFSPALTARIGASFLLLGGGFVTSLSYLTHKQSSHHLELGFSLGSFSIASIFGGEAKETFIPGLIFGYRYQPLKGGFLFKASLTPFVLVKEEIYTYIEYGVGVREEKKLRYDFQMWAGLSLGFCF